MAEGFLRSFDPEIEVKSAGTEPSNQVHPKAVTVMQELGIDLSTQKWSIDFDDYTLVRTE